MLDSRHCSVWILAAALAAVSLSARADESPATPPVAGFRADYLMEIARLRARTLALVGEVPAASYDQVVGGHSLAECVGDLTAASRHILRGMGRKLPPDREVAKGEGAAPVNPAVAPRRRDVLVEDLTATLDAVRRAVEATPDDGLSAPVDYLGRRWTVRALFLLLLGQTHEGLGHAAAHAESLGIVPPWVRQKRIAEADDD